ncbi:glutamate receptor ionotropic, kainate 2 [Anopheles ziemanni]|uniref:glutamate receptor ionotropic, kainate 2 n=1 Tax=Anopheles coustani TaxID=139045 RepID=UPI00265907AB|nr:glutamate receptor ionotropic, kainate 2 [Anopheles coustani]XP_058170262.1 glutamate receptor ionotropic, kainate 2 [Anopheles ziemanni]
MGFTKDGRLGSARTLFADDYDLGGILRYRPTRIALCWVCILVAVVASRGEGVDAQGLVGVEPEGNDTSEYYHLEMGASGEVKEREMLEIRQKLAGKTLRVTTLQDWPLSYTVKINGTMVGGGVAFDLLEFLMEKFNFTYELVMPGQNIVGSSNDMDGSVLQLLANGSADMAVAFLPILADARQHIRYSTGLDEGEWIMIMVRPMESASGSGLLAPFNRDVWILILISLLAVGPIIYGLLILRHRLTKDKEQVLYTLPHCVWFVYGALMKQGSTLSPTGDSTRILFASWWIFITILTSFYTANLTAFLTLSKFTLPINNAEDVRRKEKQFVTIRGGAVEYAIKNRDETLNTLSVLIDKRLVDFTANVNDSDTLAEKVAKHNYVFVRDRPAIDHMIYADYLVRRKINPINERVHCPYATATTPFLKRNRAFGYPLTTEWNRLFDPELLKMVEGGIIKYKLQDRLPKAEICPQNLGGTERQLKNRDLVMTYFVMVTGFVTSIVVFVTELGFRFLNQRKLNEQLALQTSKQAPTERISYLGKQFGAGDSPPPPYAEVFSRHQQGLLGSERTGKLFADANNNFANRQMINGRDYMVVREKNGLGSRLIPMRAPSAAIFHYSYAN